MNKIVFIKENSSEIRKKLKEAGFSICICASFKDSIWLVYHPNDNFSFDIHGVGYDEDNMWGGKGLSPKERIIKWLSIKNFASENREFFDNVDEFLIKYGRDKKYKN